jgi:hypothetical protein
MNSTTVGSFYESDSRPAVRCPIPARQSAPWCKLLAGVASRRPYAFHHTSLDEPDGLTAPVRGRMPHFPSKAGREPAAAGRRNDVVHRGTARGVHHGRFIDKEPS